MSLENNEYQITIRINFKSMDDLSAKEHATETINKMNIPDVADIKLQRLEYGKAPTGIKFMKGHTSGG